ncbi:MAG: hypothetical protein CVU16_03235 [Betaproteobacteria bacterium HGW-Betaproteobacteria-10]|nr:MAG: hypothetical protein CVU16_03235 [Betaproteobacteria bacterium HGW-Betaproteobacteria-10]
MPLPESEFPVIRAARTQLVGQGQTAHVLITGGRPINEPVLMIRLRLGCGVDLQRDYVLMPDAPLATGKNEAQRAMAAVNRETAAKLTQGRQRSDNHIRQPGEMPESSSRREQPPTQAKSTQARPKKPLPPNTLATLGMTGSDRILLGPAPAALASGESPMPAHSEIAVIDKQMLKLETSLHSLNEQVEHLGAALAVRAEAAALRQKLAAAQRRQGQNDSDGKTLAVSSIAPTSDKSNTGNWLELLLSALLGGGISSGIAHLLSRRRNNQANTATRQINRPPRRHKTSHPR